MKKIKLLSICILYVLTSKAQIFEWATQIGGTDDDQGASIAVDDSGYVYTSGVFSSTVDFDPGPGTFNLTSFGVKDIFISKHDSQGNFIWAKQIGGSSHDESFSIAIDKWSNIHLIGYFQGTIDVDPSMASLNFISAGNFDAFVSKYDKNGNLVWSKQFGGSLFESGNSIALDTMGNVYATGAFAGTADFDPSGATFNLTSTGSSDIYINKLDSLGNFVWAINMGSTSGDEGLSITTDLSGNVYSTGYFRDIADFDPSIGVSNLTSIGNQDIYVAKFDNAGTFIWAKSVGSTNADRSTTIAVDTAQNVYISGYYGGTIDFDPDGGTYTLNNGGNDDAFVAKLDNSGALVWAHGFGVFPSELGYSIKVSESGYVYTVGFFLNTVDFDPSTEIVNLNSGSGSVYILKFNNDGTLNWARQIASAYDRGQCIALDAQENLYITGYFDGEADFNPNSGVFTLSNSGNNNAFITKLSPCLNTSSSITASSCDSYVSPSGNYTWTTSGVHLDTISNFNGCDSIITVNLTIKNSSSSTLNISACDSYTSPSGNYTWTASGTQMDTIPNMAGCDSIITINLTIKNSSSSILNVSACDSYTSPSGNYTWTASGTQMDTIPNMAGCDSVITVNLTITTIDTAVTNSNAVLTAATQLGASYQWIDCNTMLAMNGDTLQSYTPINNGSYAVVISNNGCIDTSSCYQVISLSNESTLFEKFVTVYPNPTLGTFNITLNNNYEKIKVKISNLIGSVVVENIYTNTNNLTLNIDGEKGIYLLEIETDLQKHSPIRIIKN
ncbi:MAG: SBBP repeat-containing protein [Bacteroidia bacterium]